MPLSLQPVKAADPTTLDARSLPPSIPFPALAAAAANLVREMELVLLPRMAGGGSIRDKREKSSVFISDISGMAWSGCKQLHACY